MSKFNRSKYAAKALLGLTRGREITVYSDDLFLVSYPKSGNTWMRFLVGNLLNPEEPETFAKMESRTPDIYKTERSFTGFLPLAFSRATSPLIAGTEGLCTWFATQETLPSPTIIT